MLYKTVLTQEKDGFCQIENPEGKDNSGTIFDFLNISVLTYPRHGLKRAEICNSELNLKPDYFGRRLIESLWANTYVITIIE